MGEENKTSSINKVYEQMQYFENWKPMNEHSLGFRIEGRTTYYIDLVEVNSRDKEIFNNSKKADIDYTMNLSYEDDKDKGSGLVVFAENVKSKVLGEFIQMCIIHDCMRITEEGSILRVNLSEKEDDK